MSSQEPFYPTPDGKPIRNHDAIQVRGLSPINNWGHPFKDKNDPLLQLTQLASAAAGSYPMGVGGLWHGGVHFDSGTGVLNHARAQCMADVSFARKSVGFFYLAVLVLVSGWTAAVDGDSGVLVYSGGVDGDYKSLIYKSKSGEELRIFDEGLSFNYDSRYEDGGLSPDKSYSVVHFSEFGVLSEGGDAPGDLHKVYLCAFVRMSDGCVVSVDVGAQCGGEWSGDGRWYVPGDGANSDFLRGSPTVDKIYKDYASGRKDLAQIASPKIIGYLAEGTTLENLLVCDPPSESNENVYGALLAQLLLDGDEVNAAKVRNHINEITQRP